MTERTGVLLQQPLFYVLASVRFQPWMLMHTKIAEIQDTLRDRFPLFNQIVVDQAAFQLSLGWAESPTLTPPKPTAWAFHSSNRRLGCQISADQIVVHSRDYTSFESFAETVQFVVSAVEMHARQFDVGAVGIRYLDKITPRDDESLSDYLPETFLPATLTESGFQAIGGMGQTMFKTESGVLQARFWSGDGYMTVPDDLVPLYILTHEFESQGVMPITPLKVGNGILDSDSIWLSQQPSRMDTSGLVAKLRELHKHANKFFRSVCSEHAFKVWKGEA